MAQRFIPEIRDGDKRILMVDGEPVPYALARIPKPGENRGNLAVGGKDVGIPCRARPLDRFTGSARSEAKVDSFRRSGCDRRLSGEINVTSPTCIRELDAQLT